MNITPTSPTKQTTVSPITNLAGNFAILFLLKLIIDLCVLHEADKYLKVRKFNYFSDFKN
jgi:hypothetical protein